MNILVTGGAGYVGAHACVELLAGGHEVVVVDNLVNGELATLDGVAAIAAKAPRFVRGDILDQALMGRVMQDHAVDVVMHFAALKDPEASCRQPLAYFRNNACGMASLLQAMACAGVERIVFSSSAAVYGAAEAFPIRESAPLRPANPYGRSKLACEELLVDVSAANAQFRAVTLRYFNPVGAHRSGLIGERAGATPGNLVPRLLQVAAGQREFLAVHGSDYPTIDGTGIRDYVHVSDIATAHLRALEHLAAGKAGFTVNLGTGRGLSVLEVIRAFEQASGCSIPVRFVARREGDVAVSYADPTLAGELLGWRAALGIERMCEDAWRRHLRHGPSRVLDAARGGISARLTS